MPLNHLKSRRAPSDSYKFQNVPEIFLEILTTSQKNAFAEHVITRAFPCFVDTPAPAEVTTNETYAMSYLMKALIEQHHPAPPTMRDLWIARCDFAKADQ
jgi:hypothetical protein